MSRMSFLDILEGLVLGNPAHGCQNLQMFKSLIENGVVFVHNVSMFLMHFKLRVENYPHIPLLVVLQFERIKNQEMNP
jgi:hypothetical protein